MIKWSVHNFFSFQVPSSNPIQGGAIKHVEQIRKTNAKEREKLLSVKKGKEKAKKQKAQKKRRKSSKRGKEENKDKGIPW